MDDIRVTPAVTIPASELRWRFSRSSGAGGQHVNTSDSPRRAVVGSGRVLRAHAGPTPARPAPAEEVADRRRRDRVGVGPSLPAAQPRAGAAAAGRADRRRHRPAAPSEATDEAEQGGAAPADRRQAPAQRDETPPSATRRLTAGGSGDEHEARIHQRSAALVAAGIRSNDEQRCDEGALGAHPLLGRIVVAGWLVKDRHAGLHRVSMRLTRRCSERVSQRAVRGADGPSTLRPAQARPSGGRSRPCRGSRAPAAAQLRVAHSTSTTASAVATSSAVIRVRPAVAPHGALTGPSSLSTIARQVAHPAGRRGSARRRPRRPARRRPPSPPGTSSSGGCGRWSRRP